MQVHGGRLIALLAVVPLVSGCFPIMSPPEGIEVSKNVQYMDVPVPFKFEYDKHQSWAFTAFEKGPLQLRSCSLVYLGDNRPIAKLEAWYRDQMARHDWEYQKTVPEPETTLVFHKGTEYAEIELARILDGVQNDFITQVKARIGVR